MSQSSFYKCVCLCVFATRRENTKGGKHEGVPTHQSVMEEFGYLKKTGCETVGTDQSSKVSTYLEIGIVYTSCIVPEFKRTVYTQSIIYAQSEG